MKTKEIVKRLAEQQQVPLYKAADQLELLFHELVKKFKIGTTADVPGIGEIKAPEANIGGNQSGK